MAPAQNGASKGGRRKQATEEAGYGGGSTRECQAHTRTHGHGHGLGLGLGPSATAGPARVDGMDALLQIDRRDNDAPVLAGSWPAPPSPAEQLGGG